jgi:hypothetical protein
MRRHGHGAIINFSSTYGNGINPENAINWFRSPTAPRRAPFAA